MEWRRAKTILIFTFLVLNILIGYQLWINTDVARGWIDRSELRDEMLDKLQNKNITLEAELPSDTPKLQEITVHFSSAGISSEPKRLNEPIPIQNIGKKRVMNRVTAQIPEFKQFVLDPVLTNDQEVVYFQLYKGWPMFEVNLQFLRENDVLSSYTMRYAIVEESEQTGDEEQSVLSAFKAVGVLADYVLSHDSVIVDVRLGYHGQVYSSSTQVLAPKWRIATESGEIYYVHAISGAVEKKE